MVYALEILFPWRKDQSIIRKGFWLDAFYMFFNFFVFAIVISGFYKVLELLFLDIGISMDSIALLDLSALPVWAQLLIFFIVLDLVQWFAHILLHKYEFTNYAPEDSGTIPLRFPGDEKVPPGFLKQLFFGFGKSQKAEN